jgi:flagellar protein FliS
MAASIYAENNILHQTGVELVCLLYAESISRISLALEALDRNEIPERAAAVGSAMAIVVELQSSLDIEAGGQIAKDLALLYDYIQDRLITGHAEQQSEPFVQARQILETLLDGWHECRAALDDAKDEEITESVLAGDGAPRAWTV